MTTVAWGTTTVASVAEKPWDYIAYWFTYCIILTDYFQNKNMSMINEHKRAISEKKNLKVTKIKKCIADGKFSPTCLDQWLQVELFMLRYHTIFEFWSVWREVINRNHNQIGGSVYFRVSKRDVFVRSKPKVILKKKPPPKNRKKPLSRLNEFHAAPLYKFSAFGV